MSGYPTSTGLPWVDGLSTDPRVLGCDMHCPSFSHLQSFLLIAWFLEHSICLSNSSGLIIYNFFCNMQCLDRVKKSLLKVICPLSFNKNDSPNMTCCLRFKGFI